MRSHTPHADTRAAQAALARLNLPELDRLLIVDDSDEDATRIVTVLTKRLSPARNTHPQVQP
jgi:hypothetical protein